MTLSDYRSNPYWKAAVDLGPTLVRLADELPASESSGISQVLRQVAVELPAAIAADLMSDTSTRHAPALKLAAAVELIDKVYPALDTAAGRAAVDALLEKLFSDSFKAPAEPEASQPAPQSPPPAREVPVAEAATTPVAVETPAAPTTVTVSPVTETSAPAAPAPTEPAAAPMFSRFGSS